MTKNNIDKSNMRQVINDSANQLKKGLDLAKDIKVTRHFENVVIRGIGGSALPANILFPLVDSSIPIYAYRGYDLPKVANENSLVICVSYSGNTEEPMSGLKEAIKLNSKIIVIASGGEAEKISQQKNLPFIKIPAGIQPRSATGYLFSALVKVLANCGVVNDLSDEIIHTTEKLIKLNPSLEKEGAVLAKKLANKIPIIYSSDNLKCLARIWKIKFNENSKIPAFHNYFPELNHNEMVGYTNLKKGNNFFVLMIKDKDDHPRITKRMQLTASLLNKKGVKTDFIKTKDGSLMFRIFSNLLLGDWTSYYLALNNKVDPTPVVMVEEFKKLMK